MARLRPNCIPSGEAGRPLYAADVLPPEQARDAAAHCRELWAKRTEIANRLANQPTPELEERWRIDLLDLGILTAHLETAAANDANCHQRALTILTEAEELLGPSGVLYLERALHARALGMAAEAEGFESRLRPCCRALPGSIWHSAEPDSSPATSRRPRLPWTVVSNSIRVPCGAITIAACALPHEEYACCPRVLLGMPDPLPGQCVVPL